ncbi:alpha/beta fold hydrolase [Streptomyces sp. NPDC089795]|uniref:thioesterase II family protein n=1 Tax=Streptomyces sp. NPDC089795 TaxID=3155297 RepID=UPI00341CDE99
MRSGTDVCLFVFHHAGGSTSAFREWPRLFPPEWDVRAMEAPGRGFASRTPAARSMDELVEVFLRTVGPRAAEGPYALFGHSMGSLVAYELTKRLSALGRPPLWLGVSGNGAPRPGQGVFAPGSGIAVSGSTDDGLCGRLAGLGGTPAGVFDDPEVWEVFEPIIRNDLRVVESWREEQVISPLPVALSAYGGTTDHAVPVERLAGWARHADRFLGVRTFRGGHFYLLDEARAVVEAITADIRAAGVPAVEAV